MVLHQCLLSIRRVPPGPGRGGPRAWHWGWAGRCWQMRLPCAMSFLRPE